MERLLSSLLIIFAGLFWIVDIYLTRQRESLSGAGETENEAIDHPGTTASSFIKTILPIFGALIIGLALWQQANLPESDVQWQVWSLLGLGIIILMWGFKVADQVKPFRWSSAFERGFQFIINNRLIRITIYILFALGLGWTASRAAGNLYLMKDFPISITAYLTSIILVVYMGNIKRDPDLRIPGSDVIIAVLVFLGAFFVRGYSTSSIPVVLTGDEGSAGLFSAMIRDGQVNNIFRTGWFSFPSLYFFIPAAPIAVFGQTISALRLSSIFAGSLCAAALYLVIRPMFGKRAALFGAIFLASYNFHNHFSRLGLNNIWDSLWFTLVLGLLWVAWERENRRLFLVSGLLLGLSQSFYASSRALLILVPAWILIAGLFNRSRFKSNLVSILYMGFAALIVCLPLALYFIDFPDEFMAPMKRTTIFGMWLKGEITRQGIPAWRIIINQAWMSFKGIAHLNLKMWYEPGTPLLRVIPATLFYIGIGLLLYRHRDNRTLLLFTWVASIGILGGLSTNPPAAQRFVAIAPALAAIIGIGISEFTTIFEKIWSSQGKWVFSISLVLVLLLGADEARFYFFDYTPNSHLGGENTVVAHKLGSYLQVSEDPTEVVFFGHPRMGWKSIPSLQYLAPNVTGHNITEPWELTIIPEFNSDHLTFVFLPERDADKDAVMRTYPDGQMTTEYNEYGRILYWMYEVNTSQQ